MTVPFKSSAGTGLADNSGLPITLKSLEFAHDPDRGLFELDGACAAGAGLRLPAIQLGLLYDSAVSFCLRQALALEPIR